jgi:hypothetical protein
MIPNSIDFTHGSISWNILSCAQKIRGHVTSIWESIANTMLDINALTQNDYDNLQKSLEDQSSSMEKRLRSVFTLKSLKTDQSVEALKGCKFSVLVRIIELNFQH